ACGFSYHGPKGQIGFAPKIGAADFKAPFTTAQGWGTYTQKQQTGKCDCQLTLQYGQLELNEFHLGNSADLTTDKKKIKVLQNDKPIALGELKRANGRLVVVFKNKLALHKGDKINILWS
ncbi:MAG: hypothetical protein ACN6PN_21820, partial [Sphingobacterium sp.]